MAMLLLDQTLSLVRKSPSRATSQDFAATSSIWTVEIWIWVQDKYKLQMLYRSALDLSNFLSRVRPLGLMAEGFCWQVHAWISPKLSGFEKGDMIITFKIYVKPLLPSTLRPLTSDLCLHTIYHLAHLTHLRDGVQLCPAHCALKMWFLSWSRHWQVTS